MIGRKLSLAVIAGLIALFALPLVIDNDYIMALGISFAAMSVLAGGLNLIYGYTGLLSFAQVGFFGIGGCYPKLKALRFGTCFPRSASPG
jgi:ABC-type branched-subunit amino acid transport system permease subunit